jgi:hypothetical protein
MRTVHIGVVVGINADVHGCHLTHKSATWAKICVTRAVTLPIGLQS